MKIKSLLLKILFILLIGSGFASAEPPAGKGWKNDNPARDMNSNRQSDEDSTRGLERASERQDIKQYKDKYNDKKDKGTDKYNKHKDKDGRFRREKNKERYDRGDGRYHEDRNDKRGRPDGRDFKYDKHYDRPSADKIIEREIDDAHRRTIETVEGKTRPSNPWWRFWSSEK